MMIWSFFLLLSLNIYGNSIFDPQNKIYKSFQLIAYVIWINLEHFYYAKMFSEKKKEKTTRIRIIVKSIIPSLHSKSKMRNLKINR